MITYNTPSYGGKASKGTKSSSFRIRLFWGEAADLPYYCGLPDKKACCPLLGSDMPGVES